MLGYNTPELHPKGESTNKEDEIKKAKIARNRLIELLTKTTIDNTKDYSRKDIRKILSNNKELILIKCGDFEKYGRILAKVFCQDNLEESVNSIMLKEGHGVEYYGGSR